MTMQADVTKAIERIEEVGDVIDGWGIHFMGYDDYAIALKYKMGVIDGNMQIIKNYIHDLEMG